MSETGVERTGRRGAADLVDVMEVSIYFGHYSWVEKSGIGRARVHQLRALELQDEAVLVRTDYSRTADIIHINTIFPSSVLRARLARRRGQIVVYHAHSTEEDFRDSFRGSNILAPLFGAWLRHCYRQSDLVLTPTPYSRELLESRYRLGRPVQAISNGIDLEDFCPSEEKRRRFRERYGYSETQRVVISVGHYMERKGFPDFIRLAQRHPEWAFIWFGHTPSAVLSDEVRQMLREAPSNLTLPGFVSSAELAEAYAGSDAFAFMTREETEGIVLLEALSVRIPVFVRDIEIYREWMTDGVDCYKWQTLDELSAKLVAQFADELPDTTQAGWRVAQQRSLPEIGRQLMRIYRRLLDERARRRAPRLETGLGD